MKKDIYTAGSVKAKVVASDLLEERKKCTFDQEELQKLLLGGDEVMKSTLEMRNLLVKHSAELGNHHKFQEMSVQERQDDIWRRIRFIQTHYPEVWHNTGVYKYPYHAWIHEWQGLAPGVGLSYSMF